VTPSHPIDNKISEQHAAFVFYLEDGGMSFCSQMKNKQDSV